MTLREVVWKLEAFARHGSRDPVAIIKYYVHELVGSLVPTLHNNNNPLAIYYSKHTQPSNK